MQEYCDQWENNLQRYRDNKDVLRIPEGKEIEEGSSDYERLLKICGGWEEFGEDYSNKVDSSEVEREIKERRRLDSEKKLRKRKIFQKEPIEEPSSEKEQYTNPPVRSYKADKVPVNVGIIIETYKYPNNDMDFVSFIYKKKNKPYLTQFLRDIGKDSFDDVFKEILEARYPDIFNNSMFKWAHLTADINIITQSYLGPEDWDLTFLKNLYFTDDKSYWRYFLRQINERTDMDFKTFLEVYYPGLFFSRNHE